MAQANKVREEEEIHTQLVLILSGNLDKFFYWFDVEYWTRASSAR